LEKNHNAGEQRETLREWGGVRTGEKNEKAEAEGEARQKRTYSVF